MKEKQMMVYSYSITLLSNKKEWTTDMGNSMDQSQKNYGKWQSQPQSQATAVSFHLPWTAWRRDRNQISGCQGLCREETWLQGHKGAWSGDGSILCLDVVMVVLSIPSSELMYYWKGCILVCVDLSQFRKTAASGPALRRTTSALLRGAGWPHCSVRTWFMETETVVPWVFLYVD